MVIEPAVSGNKQLTKASLGRLSDRAILGLVLLVALVNGLVYLFLMPPWQHYDEPSHFEVVWLAAHLNRLPHPGDYDPGMSRAVVVSMVQNRFYGDTSTGIPPENQPVHIPGYSQLDEKPAYYLLASLPLRLLRLAGFEDVTDQLKSARFASLALYLLTIVCSWGVTCEITRSGHVLRWMVPLSIALLPGFADLMTAVNNDVGAVTVFSLFLWGSVRLIRRPFSILNLIWVLAVVVLAYFTKVTALVTLALLPVVLLFAFLRGRFRWLAWAALGITALLALVASLSWGDAAWWARNTFQNAATRTASSLAPLGSHAFQLQIEPGSAAADNQLHQIIDLPTGVRLDNNDVTVGAWIWANHSVQANTPVFGSYNGLQTVQKAVDLDETPRFFAFTAQVDGNAERNIISLAPLFQAIDQPVTVYYDGVLALPGRWPLDQQPIFGGASGKTGTWGGQRFVNLVRDSSAETAWLRLRPWVDKLGVRILPDEGSNQPSVTLYYFLDVAASWPYQRLSAEVLFRTFWAYFGWGHIALMQLWPYLLIQAALLIGLIGAVIAIWRLRHRLDWGVLTVLGLAFLTVWMLAYMRGANYPTQVRAIYYPTARYAYPVIIPSMVLLNVGWWYLAHLLMSRLRWSGIVFKAGYILAWTAFNIYALLSIVKYYYF